MRLAVILLVIGACLPFVVAQEAPPYRSAENPYQEDLAFSTGQLVVLRVDVQGVQLDGLTVIPQREPTAGELVPCNVQLSGTNQAAGKVIVTTVLLLEDANGRGIERVQLESFKVKSGRQFAETSEVDISGAALLAARRVYVFIELSF